MVKKNNHWSRGFFLLILFMLVTFYSGMKRINGNVRTDKPEKIVFIQEERKLSPYHKVTLNIPISLNNVSSEGLTAISGIGPSLSQRIIEERRKNGGFTDLKQLKKLPGVGDKLYERIIPYLKL